MRTRIIQYDIHTRLRNYFCYHCMDLLLIGTGVPTLLVEDSITS